jgi:hypothetical protein
MKDSFDKVLLDMGQQRQRQQQLPWTAKAPVAFGRHNRFCKGMLSE